MVVTGFTFDSTAEEVASHLAKDISGKNVLINGASWNSLGAEAARVIAKYAHLVILGGRSPDNIQRTIDNIKTETPSANLRAFKFDMSTLAGAREAAEEVNKMLEPIHVVILSAGLMAVPFTKTSDGLEQHMAVNHFAPFLFTALIFPKLQAAGTPSVPARIISITSMGHKYGGLQPGDVNFGDGKTYDKWVAYGQSKTANVLFSNEIARRAKESGVNVVSFAVHPGSVGGTSLGIHLTPEDYAQFQNADGSWVEALKSQAQGAAGYIAAAFDPRLVPYSGGYIDNADLSESSRAEHARSQADGERLWSISETTVGEQFVI